MTASTLLLFVLVALLACVASVCAQECFYNVSAPVAASRVLGQSSFTTSSGTSIVAPVGVAASRTTGKVVVSLQGVAVGSPVLARFASTGAMFEQTPEGYFANNVASGTACSATTLKAQGSKLHIDKDDTLYISDSDAHRVVGVYDISTADLSTGSVTFDFSLGVALPSDACPEFAAGNAYIYAPQSIYVDYVNADGGIWVAAEQGVAKFSELGQTIPDGYAGRLVGDTCTPTNSYIAYGVAIDPLGNLWVADTNNQRVLGYGNASALALDNSDAAIQFFGQTNLTTCTRPDAASASTLSTPMSLTFDSDGTLFISDYFRYRVLVILNAATAITTGGQADFQLGQASFIDSTFSDIPTAANINPISIDYDFYRNELLVTDTPRNRVVSFCNSIAAAPNGTATEVPSNATASNATASAGLPSSNATVSNVTVSTGALSTGAPSNATASTGTVSTGVASTGVASTGVASTGVASAGVASTGVASTGVASTGVASTGVASTGVASTVVRSTGVASSVAASPANPSRSGAAPSAAATPSKVVRCGDGSKDLYEQCDPPSVLGCCSSDCNWAPIDQVCAAAQSVCHKERRCVYQNAIVRTGRQCGPGGLKGVGARCSDYNPRKMCTAAGLCQ
jgi:hypothetical protein